MYSTYSSDKPVTANDIKEAMEALNKAAQCPFEKLANSKGFSLSRGDILFLPESCKKEIEGLPVNIPAGVKFTPYISTPILIKNRIL